MNEDSIASEQQPWELRFLEWFSKKGAFLAIGIVVAATLSILVRTNFERFGPALWFGGLMLLLCVFCWPMAILPIFPYFWIFDVLYRRKLPVFGARIIAALAEVGVITIWNLIQGH